MDHIISIINNYVKNVLGIILKVNYDFNSYTGTLVINYIGRYKSNYSIDDYFKNNLNGIIIKSNDGKYIQIFYEYFQLIPKGILLKLNFIVYDNYYSYFDYLNYDCIGIILSFLHKSDFINSCNSITIDICNDTNLYLFLILENFPNIAKLIKIIESIDNINYNNYYKDLYSMLLDKGESILSISNILGNGLLYRLLFYVNYPGVYHKINNYMDDNSFNAIMGGYIFSKLFTDKNNIYSIYAKTGLIDTQYCDNFEDYQPQFNINEDGNMVEILDTKMILGCIIVTNDHLLKFRDKIVPWIQNDDILTWFMIMDLKEISNPEDIVFLRELLIQKYKKTIIFSRLLNIFDNYKK